MDITSSGEKKDNGQRCKPEVGFVLTHNLILTGGEGQVRKNILTATKRKGEKEGTHDPLLKKKAKRERFTLTPNPFLWGS